MNSFFWISYTVLWLLIVPLLLLNLILFRQLGIVVMGTARGVGQSGLPVGKSLPNVSSITTEGKPWSTDLIKSTPSLLLFGSPTCKECADIMPDLEKVAKKFGITPTLLLFADIDSAKEYANKLNLKFDVVQISHEMGHKLDVEISPFAYGVDSYGVIRGKGLVNELSQLESIARSAVMKIA